MRDVGLALFAAAVGYLLARLQERQRLRRQAGGAARILYRDVFSYVTVLHVALHRKQWPPPVMTEGKEQLTLDNWRRLDTQLAEAMRDRHGFEDVQMTFEAMAEMLKPETVFDERWMRKVHDRVAFPALEALEGLTVPISTRIRRRINAFRRRVGLPSKSQQ